MGKGDIRTRRGKIHRGTYGISRPKKRKKKPEKPVEAAKTGKAGS
ncbi:MAG: 30S ribosomal protein THX [Gemmatimonadetes bacterium]|nr:MAG: 30S ribosomal protein THX [Gemmatimonadota bacterium]PYO99088.1 MAG: 30S ribosomal protein THX [Gemmatimonadota bacterium]TLY54922.1 MAG: 30S ribosomal protein THX [Gemmatimonadota bacterium]